MKLLWTVAAFLCFHWEDVSGQMIPTGTCDCATFARNTARPKRPLVTWPAGDTSCSASSVARCRLECNKFFRTFEFDALDLVCGSLHEASRVQILFGYRICKSKWHSLGLSEEPICCRKSRPIHCDSLEASRRHQPAHGELAAENKRKAPKKSANNKNDPDKPESAKERGDVAADDDDVEDEDDQEEEDTPEDKKKPMKKTEAKLKPTQEEPKKTTKKPEKEEPVTKKPAATPKPKDKAQASSQEDAEKPEQELTRRSSGATGGAGGGGGGGKNKAEAETEDAAEEEEDDDMPAEDEDKPMKKAAKKGPAQKPVMRKRQRMPQKHDEEE